jgi:hypothetical protein
VQLPYAMRIFYYSADHSVDILRDYLLRGYQSVEPAITPFRGTKPGKIAGN